MTLDRSLLIDSGQLDADPNSPYTPRVIYGARVEIHDKTTHALVEVLEHAYQISYDLQINAAAVGAFMLPRNDPKWAAVQPYAEVWMYNAIDELIELFRIAPIQERRVAAGTIGQAKLEGYATALQDDLVSTELIFTNQLPSVILGALLGYQATPRVTLGIVDAPLDRPISTRASFVNIMRACWEVRNIVGGYIYVDTNRRLHLRSDPGADIGQRAYKGWNLRELSKSTEAQAVATKVWPLGRGEGRTQQRPSMDKLVAQPATFTFVAAGSRSTLVLGDTYSRYKGWTVAGGALPDGTDATDTRSRPLKVYRAGLDDTANWEQGADERTLRSKTNGYNPGAGPWTLDYVHADYLIADDTVPAYGTISTTLTDKTLESSAALITAARTLLDAVKSPRVSYEVRVQDLARLYPNEPVERLHLFDKVTIVDPDLAVTTKSRIVGVRYGDLLDPATFEIIVADLDLAALSSRAVSVADRVRKYENQPDGATTLLGPDSFEDNLDPTHPYTRNIEIPTEAVSVLMLKLRMRTKAYRYYVSAASSSSAGSAHSHVMPATSVNLNTNVQSAFHTHLDGDGITNTGNESVNHTHPYSDYQPGAGTSNDSPAHSHTITSTLTPGIVETTTPSAMTVAVDGTALPGTATSLDDADLTPYLSRNADGSIVRGLHTVTFTPNANGRIQATLKGLVFLQSRGVIVG